MKPRLVLIFIIFWIPLYGQFSRGVKYVDVSISTSTYHTESSNTAMRHAGRYFGVGPSVGVFANPRMAVGIGLWYSHQFIRDDYTPAKFQSTTWISLNPKVFGRRLFQVTDRFFFFVEAYAGFLRASQKNHYVDTGISLDPLDTHSTYYQLFVSLGPGFLYFPSPKWGFELNLGYVGWRYRRNLAGAGNTPNGLYASFGTTGLGLGVNYYFLR